MNKMLDEQGDKSTDNTSSVGRKENVVPDIRNVMHFCLSTFTQYSCIFIRPDVHSAHAYYFIKYT